MTKPIRCRLGRHHLKCASTEDGQRFEHCERCGEDVFRPGWYMSTTPPAYVG